MATKQVQLHRDYYSLENVAVLLDREPEDLIYLAATAKLPLYIITDSWEARAIKELDRIFDGKKPARTLTGIKDKDVDPVISTDLGDGKIMTYQYDRANYEFDLGPIRVVSKTGGLRVLYSLTLSGPQLLTVSCIEKLRDKDPKITVEIDLTHHLKAPESYPVIWHFDPEAELLLSKAIEKDLVVVMATDIKRIIEAAETHKEKSDESPLGTRERNTLLLIISALGELAQIADEPYTAADEVLLKLSDKDGNSPVKRRTIAEKIIESREARKNHQS